MKRIFLLICFMVLASACHAQSIIERISIEPLSGGVSFNTINFVADYGNTGWITANSVIGRKEILILNTSLTDNIFITGVSGSTATGIIYPRESVTFKASSSLNLYVSANTITSVQIWEIR